VNTQTLAQLFEDCGGNGGDAVVDAIALAFFTAGASAAMLMLRRGDTLQSIYDQLETMSSISGKTTDKMLTELRRK
jgi:hypothetical protein